MNTSKPNIAPIRIATSIITIILGIEILGGGNFTQIQNLSAYSLLNINIWLFPLIGFHFISKFLVGLSMIVMGSSLAAGRFIKEISIVLATIFLLGIITDSLFFISPLASLSKTIINLSLAGTAFALIASELNPASIKKIIRIILGISCLAMFSTAFLWTGNGSNILWSYYFNQISIQIFFLPFPVIAAIIGSAASLLLLNIGTKISALTLTLLFSTLFVITPVSGFLFFGIIGLCICLLPTSRLSFPRKKRAYKSKKSR